MHWKGNIWKYLVVFSCIQFDLHNVNDERKVLFVWPRPRPGLGHKSGGACLGVPFYAPPCPPTTTTHPQPKTHIALSTQHVQYRRYVNSSIVGVNFMLTLALYSHPGTLLLGKEHRVSQKKGGGGGGGGMVLSWISVLSNRFSHHPPLQGFWRCILSWPQAEIWALLFSLYLYLLFWSWKMWCLRGWWWRTRGQTY